MLLFRVMNEFDMAIDPIKNGLASKKMIYDLTRKYLYANERDKILNMTQIERDEFIKSYMYKYLINHNYKLSKIFRKNHAHTMNTIHHHVDDKDKFAYCQMIKDLSSLPNHLINGSKTYTNWISATNNFDGIWNYYDRQKIHEIVVLNVYTNGVFDNSTYIVDLSNRDIINNIRFLSNRIDDSNYDEFMSFISSNPEYQEYLVKLFNNFVMRPTDKKFMGFNFAISSNEYCIYQYLSKESVLSVLESLQIDLICADIFNEEYLLLNPRKQIQELVKLKEMILRHIQEEKDTHMLYVFDELYMKKHNISEIACDSLEREKIILTRNKIITKLQTLPSILIKKKKRII